MQTLERSFHLQLKPIWPQRYTVNTIHSTLSFFFFSFKVAPSRFNWILGFNWISVASWPILPTQGSPC